MKITEQRAASIEFWYKGSVSDNSKIVNLYDPSEDHVYLSRDGDDFILATSHSSNEFKFNDAYKDMDNTGWVFVGVSLGYIAESTRYIPWGYIYQQSSGYEHGGCGDYYTISSSNLDSGDTFEWR